MAEQRPPIAIRIHDAGIGIWQDNAQDPTFRAAIYSVLIRDMRARGWAIHQDPDIRHHFSSLNANHRRCARGTLGCKIKLSGRVVEVEFWSVTAPQVNRNGREYDFDKMQRMAHIDRLRVELEFRRIVSWVETLAPTTVTRSADRDLPPMARIEKSYAESWHSDKQLGRPVCQYDYNRKSVDGRLLEHGQTVWLPDRKGRMIRGQAFYNINNMWWVIAGGKLHNEGSHALHCSPPADVRTKRNDRARRNRLEAELAIAVRRMQFDRAQILKHIIFGREPAFLIWSRKDSAYYRSQYAGYTTDTISAGKYTRGEAEAECRRCPEELEMVCPDGSRVSFEKRAA